MKEKRQEVEFDSDSWARAPTLSVDSKKDIGNNHKTDDVENDEPDIEYEYDEDSDRYQRFYTAKESNIDKYVFGNDESEGQPYDDYEDDNIYKYENKIENELASKDKDYLEDINDYYGKGFENQEEQDENTQYDETAESETHDDVIPKQSLHNEAEFVDYDADVEKYSPDEYVDDMVAAQEDEYRGDEEESLSPYTLKQIEKKVEVRYISGKGRCLFTREAAEPGSIIFIEEPLLVAIPSLHDELWSILNHLNEEETFDLPPIWHLASLCSLTMLETRKVQICFDKWVPEPNKEPGKDVQKVLDTIDLNVDPQLYERMLQVWRYNSFGHHTESNGLILYNRLSMMAHDCQASGCWHYGENDSFVLRARIRLPAGSELTISYIGDDELFKSTEIRREKLQGWLFTCHCKRCNSPVDNARGFRCPVCGTGTMYFKTEEDDTFSSPCTLCQAVPSEETIKEYLDFEKAYADRLDDTDKSDMADAETVYNLATRVFTNHWVLYQLHTKLFEGYRDREEIDTAIFHQMERLKYATQVTPLASYTLPWLYEELGDMLVRQINPELENADKGEDAVPAYKINRISRAFEDAYNILYIMCGASHEYTNDCMTKKTQIDKYLPPE